MDKQRNAEPDKVPDCFKKYTPLPPFVQKTEVENAIDVCLDVCGIFGEERTYKLIEINRRLGLWEMPPCMK